MGAMLMQVLDTTIANVALPHMQASLGATQDSITWVLTSYILASAVAIPVTGWLSDKFSIRSLFLVSVVIFVCASVLCGIATSLPEMVAFRIIQGIGGAFLAPLAQTILLDVTKPSDHGKITSVYGMGIMIGPIVGPILGGWLTESFDWRWVFFVNIPIGITCFIALWFLLPRKSPDPRTFDLAGWAMIALGLAGMQLMLDRGPLEDWFSSTEIWIEAGVAVTGLWMFGVHMMTARRPLFPIAMLRDRNLISGALFMFVMGLVMMAAMALLPTMLQSSFGYPVIDTGILLASRGVGVLLTMALTGRLAQKVDPRMLVCAGFLIMAGSLWLMTGWSLNMDWKPIVTSGFVQGVGLGLVFVPLNMLSFATLPRKYRTDAASLLNLARSLGSSVGIAIVTALLSHNVQVSHSDIAATITPYNLPVDPSMVSVLGRNGDAVMSALDGMVNQQAAMVAYLDDFYFMMFLTLSAIPLILLLRRPERKAADDDLAHMVME
ncbi:DHA2 family efflux MFS transporter permease subunit [Sphingobium sp.]|uniref:DHA2 family efflux MFS transporter permease subunit n=1 Tax=Sphingobium sp. TaxID=1912891 RepID=UPI0039B881F9